MFDGMPEQFYQFLAARTTTPPTNNIPTTSLPLSFTLHNHTNNAHHHHFPTYSSSPTQQQQHTFDASYHHLLQQHHHHPHFLTRHNNVIKDDDDEDESTAGLDPSHHHSAAAADLQTQQHVHTTTTLHDASQTSLTMLLPEIPWSNDEMLALFRIRSSVDNTWFPDYIWETVSRKLAELGFKRSAEKCKEKFEEETRSFNSSIISNCNNNNSNKNNNNNNYRLFHELEELCNNNNNNANNTMNGSDDHVSLQQQHPLLAPTTLAPSERDQFSQPPLSRKDQCLDGDEEDDENNEDGEDDLGMDDEGDNAGGERLGDEEEEEEEEEEEGGDHTRNDENKNNVGGDEAQSVDDSEKTEENTKRGVRKRKRQKKFEMFKGFCEKIVNEMMAQQQQLHYKILQDMVKRDEEKIAKEEAWKKQEIERLEKELEVRAHEQAIAGDRQAKIFDFLKKFSTSSSNNVLDTHSLRDTLEKLNKVPNFTSSNNSSILSQDSIISAPLQPTSSCTTHDDTHTPPLVNHQTSCPDIIPISSSNENLALLSPIRLESSKLAPRLSSSSMDQASQNPNLVISHNDSPTPPPSVVSSSKKFSRPDHTSTDATEHVTNSKTLEDQNDTTPVVRSGKDDTGRRWPRDEVLALINIRCSLFNNNNNGSGGEGHNDKEGFSKGPLWERISHKMTELGYKRSAKRCKEKWENINKYFRKTKDMNKKRSIDSRTCPYFHQLSHLYSQGTLVGPTDRPADLPGSPETRPGVAFSVTQGGSNTPANDANNPMHTSQGNEGVVQVPGFDFEF